MAVGKEIVSAFFGPADLISFDLITHKTSSQTIHVKNRKKDWNWKAFTNKLEITEKVKTEQFHALRF